MLRRRNDKVFRHMLAVGADCYGDRHGMLKFW
jgi:hypothetical protein